MSGLEKEISIGGITKEQLIKQLIEAGIQFNEYTNTLRTFTPSVRMYRRWRG